MIDCSEKKGGKTAFTTWASKRVRSTRDVNSVRDIEARSSS